MHVRVRMCGVNGEEVVVVPSRLSKVELLRPLLKDKFGVEPQDQRLFYGGKLLENGYTLHDYSIKLNDVVQLMSKTEESNATVTDANVTVKYEDAVSEFYQVGDLIDATTGHNGWFEAKISKILQNVISGEHPRSVHSNATTPKAKNRTPNKKITKKSKTPSKSPSNGKKTSQSNGIMSYFNADSKMQSNPDKADLTEEQLIEQVREFEEEFFIFKIEVQDGEDEQDFKISQIRPRARNELNIDDLTVNQTVMLNYNIEEPHEKGFWFDFTVHEVKKNRKNTELYGTLHQGNDVMINDIRIQNHDKIYAIETVVPLKNRSKDYQKIMNTEPEKRSLPLNCTTCKDKPNASCKDCGCYVCAGKNQPELIILCDECNMGFHLVCLKPPLEKLPEDDWYCPDCRRDSDEIIAPGKAQQKRKADRSKSKKDWGRGMACVGKTQTCSMPANHFGPIPGIEVGMCWRFRIQLSESGVHRPPVSGIHGRDVDGAYSIVLSGGYEDDTDDGFEFTYTGSGGRDLSGNRRTADQSSDQTLTRENRALAKNCAVKEINEEGADAEDNWKNGKPVRVVRSYKMKKHFPEFAPKEGNRYDGIYKVIKYYPETGKSGFRVWKYLLRRDDPNPAPWEKNSKTFPIIYPDGYLEAEAEKRALKEKQKQNIAGGGKKRKRVLKENNGDVKNSSDEDVKNEEKNEPESPPIKKRKTRSSVETLELKSTPMSKKSSTPKSKKKSNELKSPTQNVNPFTIAASKKSISPKNSLQNENSSPDVLTQDELDAIECDKLNKKIWDECLALLKTEGKQGLINKVTTLFLCIICQEVVTNPTTVGCGHNFCISCLKLAFKSTHAKQCPYCRADLSQETLETNDVLKAALRAIMPGYDGRKS